MKEEKPNVIARNPVAVWGSIGVLVGLILNFAVPDLNDEAVNAIVQAVLVAGPAVVGLWYSRSKVTPTVDPRTDEGEKLVPASSMFKTKSGAGR